MNNSVLVPLVNPNGDITGYGEKMAVHRRGDLHLAFSVMLFRTQATKTEFLLQRRATDKYHSGDAWSNTCCSHPLPDESIQSAAKRRLNEELGLTDNVDFENLRHIIYKSQLDNNMIEHEYDVVLAARVEQVNLSINPDEVSQVKWWSQEEIEYTLKHNPDTFTVWFKLVYQRVSQFTGSTKSNKLVSNA